MPKRKYKREQLKKLADELNISLKEMYIRLGFG